VDAAVVVVAVTVELLLVGVVAAELVGGMEAGELELAAGDETVGIKSRAS